MKATEPSYLHPNTIAWSASAGPSGQQQAQLAQSIRDIDAEFYQNIDAMDKRLASQWRLAYLTTAGVLLTFAVCAAFVFGHG